MSYQNLLKHALILDTETLGLQRGSPIHEVAIYNFDTKEAYEYILKPRMVEIEGSQAQDLTRLASSVYDVHHAVDFPDWRTAVKEVAAMSAKVQSSQLATDVEIQKALQVSNPFLHRALYGAGGLKYPHLMDTTSTLAQQMARQSRLKQHGVSAFNTQAGVLIEDLLKPGALIPEPKGLQGTTLWIANAPFESKQLGAQLGAMGQGTVDIFKSQFETSSRYADPMYITGRGVNEARVAAQLTGDWTQVWKAYQEFTPKPGEVAVRDIQDVSRAMMSYGKKLGLMKGGGKDYFGASIDLQYRLLGSLEKDPRVAASMLLTEEVHRAVEDAAISERYVLEKSLHYTSVLQQVSEGTAEGQRLLTEAAGGSGPLHEISLYFKRLEAVAPIAQRNNLIKRLERAAIDIQNDGVSWQMTGYKGIQRMEQMTHAGRQTTIPRLRPDRTPYRDMDSVVDYLAKEGSYGNYGIDVHKEWASMRAHITEAEQRQVSKEAAIVSYSTQETSEAISSFFHKNANQLLDLSSQVELKRLNSTYGNRIWKEGLEAGIQNIPRAGQAFGVAAVGLAAMGMLWSIGSGPNSSSGDRQDQSLMTMNYEEWQAAQAQREGLAEQGIAKQYRHLRTDFGSPYQGPTGVQEVFYDQDLLKAREQWMRSQYGARHFDPVDGLFGLKGIFSSVGRSSYTYNHEGRALGPGELPGIKNRRGMQVMDVDRDKWEIDVEDADTITLKRKGVVGAVSRFFGLSSGSYNFRLEGIDAPEIRHGTFDNSWHTPQPGGDNSTLALRQMLKDGNIQIAFDPSEQTYGRNVGVVYAQGKNINLEEVKRGLAAHLPYGKQEDSHVNWGEFSFAEQKSIASNRGMWATPWAQVYSEFVQQSGQRITFHTFTDPNKVAQNSGTMGLLSTMEQAQAMGFANESQIQLAHQLGKSWNPKGDNVRPFLMDLKPPAHYTNYMPQMMYDHKRFMNTYGTNSSPYRYSVTAGTGDLNAYMALDSMGSTNSPWSRRQLDVFDRYGNTMPANQNRKARMAAMQRSVNQSFGVSPIGHNRM